MYAKMKELGPVGGHALACPPPRSAYEVGPYIGMKFHQEVMEIVSYDIHTA